MRNFITDRPSKRKTVLLAAFWLLVWQISYWVIGKEVIFPSPANTLQALGQMIVSEGFYQDVGATMFRVILGIVISFAAGLGTAVAAHFIFVVKDIMGAAIHVLKSTPVMAVIIFALLWLPSGEVPVFVCFLMCYPIVYTNVLAGLESMSKEYLEMSHIYHIRRSDLIRFIYLPFVMPHLKSAMSLTTGLSWKTVVAAEVLSSPDYSMGYNLLNAKVYLETESLFAWIIAIVTFSIVFEKGVNFLLKGKTRGVKHDRNS